MPNLTPFEERVISDFKKKYKTAYSGILSNEILDGGNKWFEDFILSALKDQREELKGEILDKIDRLDKYRFQGIIGTDPTSQFYFIDEIKEIIINK